MNIFSKFLQVVFNHIFSICYLQSVLLGTGDIIKKEKWLLAWEIYTLKE